MKMENDKVKFGFTLIDEAKKKLGEQMIKLPTHTSATVHLARNFVTSMG